MKLFPPALLLIAAPAAAQLQVHVTVGPDPAPLTAPVSVTVSNDMFGFISVTGCPLSIFDADMNHVADVDSGCGGVVDIGPYGWRTFQWNQRDESGQQVPAGDYYARVEHDFQSPTFHPFSIDAGVLRNLVLEGTPATKDPLNNEHRHFYLSAPQDGGFFYWLMASLTAGTGLPTCGGTFPLDDDLLLQLSAPPNKALLQNFGMLSPAGSTKAPRIPIPDDPDLIGLELFAAFLVVDFAADPCIVRGSSLPYRMVVIE